MILKSYRYLIFLYLKTKVIHKNKVTIEFFFFFYQSQDLLVHVLYLKKH